MATPPKKRGFFQPGRKPVGGKTPGTEPKGGAGRPFRGKQGGARGAGTGEARKGWDQVAGWYDKLVGDGGSDYHRNVVIPAAMRLLDPQEGERILDLCCGQGVLVPHLLEAGAAEVVGVDASPKLIEAARSRSRGDRRVKWVVADACEAGEWADGSFDALACLMAVHDVPDLDGMAAAAAAALKPGGRWLAIFMHPCFRIPRQAHWGWDEGRKLQYRRIDRYGVPQEIPIVTHPGQGGGETTTFYHRPLGQVISAFGRAGLVVRECEELHGHRRSQPGPRARGENRAVEEFPIFLALEGFKAGGE